MQLRAAGPVRTDVKSSFLLALVACGSPSPRPPPSRPARDATIRWSAGPSVHRAPRTARPTPTQAAPTANDPARADADIDVDERIDENANTGCVHPPDAEDDEVVETKVVETAVIETHDAAPDASRGRLRRVQQLAAIRPDQAIADLYPLARDPDLEVAAAARRTLISTLINLERPNEATWWLDYSSNDQTLPDETRAMFQAMRLELQASDDSTFD